MPHIRSAYALIRACAAIRDLRVSKYSDHIIDVLEYILKLCMSLILNLIIIHKVSVCPLRIMDAIGLTVVPMGVEIMSHPLPRPKTQKRLH